LGFGGIIEIPPGKLKINFLGPFVNSYGFGKKVIKFIPPSPKISFKSGI